MSDASHGDDQVWEVEGAGAADKRKLVPIAVGGGVLLLLLGVGVAFALRPSWSRTVALWRSGEGAESQKAYQASLARAQPSDLPELVDLLEAETKPYPRRSLLGVLGHLAERHPEEVAPFAPRLLAVAVADPALVTLGQVAEIVGRTGVDEAGLADLTALSERAAQEAFDARRAVALHQPLGWRPGRAIEGLVEALLPHRRKPGVLGALAKVYVVRGAQRVSASVQKACGKALAPEVYALLPKASQPQRRAAAHLLVQLAPDSPQSAEAVAQVLNDPELQPHEAKTLLEGLKVSDPEPLLGPVLALLNAHCARGGDQWVRGAAVATLKRFPPEPVASALEEALGADAEKSAPGCRAALSSLASGAPKTWLPVLCVWASSSGPRRTVAIQVLAADRLRLPLGELYEVEGTTYDPVDLLLRAMRDPDPEISDAAKRFVLSHGRPKVQNRHVPSLLLLEPREARQVVVNGGRQLTPGPLMDALASEQVGVRRSAAEVLAIHMPVDAAGLARLEELRKGEADPAVCQKLDFVIQQLSARLRSGR